MRIAHALLFCALAAVTLAAQHAAAIEGERSKIIEDVYLARDNGAGKAGEVTDLFTPADVPIHCVVVLRDGEPKNVRMNFVAVKVPGVKPETKVVSTVYTTQRGHNRVSFTGRPHGLWTPGTYRIDIYVADAKEWSIELEVKGPVQLPARRMIDRKPKPTTARKN